MNKNVSMLKNILQKWTCKSSLHIYDDVRVILASALENLI